MTDLRTAVVVAGTAGAATYVIRASFLAFAHRAGELSPHIRAALRMIPPAALAALVSPALLRPGGTYDLIGPEALAGLVGLLVAWRTRNMVATIALGFAALLLLRALLP